MAGRTILDGLIRRPSAAVVGLQAKVWLGFCGQSNGHGVSTDATYTGNAIEANTTCNYDDVDVVAWDNAISQAVDASTPGPAPWFANRFLASAGVTSVHSCVQAANGSYIAETVNNQIESIRANFLSEGYDPDTDRADIYWFGGENESHDTLGSLAQSIALENTLVRIGANWRAEWPLARFHVVQMFTNDANHDFADDARTAIAAAQARITSSTMPLTRSPTLVDDADGVHLATTAAGFGAIADRALVLALTV